MNDDHVHLCMYASVGLNDQNGPYFMSCEISKVMNSLAPGRFE